MPVGVPGSGGGGGGELLLPPPPQDATKRVANKIDRVHEDRFFLVPQQTTIAKSSPVPSIDSAKRRGVRNATAEVGAFVLTVTAEDVVANFPLAFIGATENVQAASEGRPEQARLIDPLNPVEVERLTEVAPEPPGALINTVDFAVVEIVA